MRKKSSECCVSGTEKGIDNKLVFLYKKEEGELSHTQSAQPSDVTAYPGER